MRVFNSEKLSPYGEIDWLPAKDVERLIYVYKVVHEEDGFKPPAVWFCNDSLGNRVYFRARDRKKALELMIGLFGSEKYSLISDKSGTAH